ncbi:MAG: glycosylase, partial [Clostridia bacterium]|nr:glycosylase [Clostridia bacterium]
MTNWLGNAVVYEIYPQSFYDTNGDGIGDLRGVIEKLDYIEECGFNVIWLNPINESAFLDAGYDVTDFYKVASRYGTNEDYRELCDAAHARGMRVLFDLVAGHTSVHHPWFIASAKAEKNEYSNRYIWTEGAFDYGAGISGYAERDGNYINNFFWHQPSLNYGYAHPDPRCPWQLPVDHPDCRATLEELKKIIGFWMDYG